MRAELVDIFWNAKYDTTKYDPFVSWPAFVLTMGDPCHPEWDRSYRSLFGAE